MGSILSSPQPTVPPPSPPSPGDDPTLGERRRMAQAAQGPQAGRSPTLLTSGLGDRQAAPEGSPAPGPTEDESFRLVMGPIAGNEGGLANHPEDRRGKTYKGIPQQTLDELRTKAQWQHLPADVAQLSDSQITDIYRKVYFEQRHIPELAWVPGLYTTAPYLPQQVFDAGVLYGPTWGGRWLQQALDKTLGTDLRSEDDDGTKYYDGGIGPLTLAAVDRAMREGKIKEVNNLIVDMRKDRARNIVKNDPKQADFLEGWLRRAESFRQ